MSRNIKNTSSFVPFMMYDNITLDTIATERERWSTMAKTVLIVDDQLGIRLLLEEIVKSEGYQVFSCANGKEALAFIEQTPPDLMLIDLRLPIIDGAAIIEKLEADQNFIPTIMMSGLAEEAKRKTKEFSSVKEIFSKPFNIEDAKYHINRLLKEKN